jgi:hypothetical protein
MRKYMLIYFIFLYVKKEKKKESLWVDAAHQRLGMVIQITTCLSPISF